MNLDRLIKVGPRAPFWRTAGAFILEWQLQKLRASETDWVLSRWLLSRRGSHSSKRGPGEQVVLGVIPIVAGR